MLLRAFRLLASLKLAVSLIVLLAVVLAAATILEAARGREYAMWYVYGSYWFSGLLAMLGVNILAAALIRFPWKQHQAGFVITHAGLLVLLGGSIQTFLGGIEGQVSLLEGEMAHEMTLTDRSSINVTRNTSKGQSETKFSFRPGPVDWPAGKAIDFGESDSLELKVLTYLRHARKQVEWVEDDSRREGPALNLILSNEHGHAVQEDWLMGGYFGGEAVLGPTKFQVWPVSVESMVEDFLAPPAGDILGERGIVAVHYRGHRIEIVVDDQLGEEVPLSDDGAKVEIVAYLPDARPTPDGRFATRGDEPKNPLLELKVHLPGQDEPIRQVSFARLPLMNLDAVHGRVCPAKFWYHHPAYVPAPGAEFLQTPDGKLHCRTIVEGQYQAPHKVSEGERLRLGGGFHVSLLKYLPHARKEVRFISAPPGAEDGEDLAAAAQVEVALEGKRHRVWLRRNDPRYGQQWIVSDQGPVQLSLGYDRLPLGFTLKLNDFVRDFNPGGRGAAAFASRVRVIDPEQGINEERKISMNEPLVNGKFTLYQSSFQETAGGQEASVFSAAYDPGRWLKYVGSLMICAGTFVMFFLRAAMFRKWPLWRGGRTGEAAGSNAEQDFEPSSKDPGRQAA